MGSSFVVTGPTAPGDATFVSAPYSLGDIGPTGDGDLHVTVDGQLYAAATLDSFAFGLTDDDDVPYLALIDYKETPGPSDTMIDGVVVIVPASDFAVGATVALDGNQRLALFDHGPRTTGSPHVFAAAVTGSVTFTAGTATLSGTVSAAVSGDFAPIEFVPGPGDAGNAGTISDGTYTLAVQASPAVHCEGSLAGHEAAFSSVTAASLGLAGGAVTLTRSDDVLAISGAPITAGYGVPSLDLQPLAGIFVGSTSDHAPGPAGTTFVGKYVVLDATTASPQFINAGLGAGFVNSDSQCSVSFGATLMAP
ncbi:MAG: hypothetical protein ABI867_10890 [Kofleriaceae bacterium]